MEREDRGRPGLRERRDEGGGTVRVELLGGFRVRVGSRVVEDGDWRLGKAGVLVAMLALAPGHRLHREQIMDPLWPDLDARAARNNFHRVLHEARRALDPETPADRHPLRLERGRLALCPEGGLSVDVEAFERAAAAARRSRDPAAYRAAIERYPGDLLPGRRHEDWARERRYRLRRSYLQLLSELAALEEGDAPTRRSGGRETEPLTEGPGAAGQAALGGYRGRARPELEGAPNRHNLPRSQSSFVGRRHELAAIRHALEGTPLLTLTGPGGAGKTRLALEAARAAAAARPLPGGAWLVELAPLADGALAGRAAAAAVGAREGPGAAGASAAAGRLAGAGRALVVLDNCEHLVDAAAELAETLLLACPELRILATSREPLGVPGEALWPVPPLSVPADAEETTADLLRHEAVQLFVERARSRLPGFALTAENAAAVASVCRKLDGIPLAIELAAARTNTLAVERVAERLDDSLALLGEGDRTLAPRHRTLRATLDWSHGLLGEPERRLFRRLAVFVSGFTLAAAEEVCSGDGLPRDEVLLVLSRLVERSLVVATGLEGEPRYRMLTMVHQYAGERLRSSGEWAALRARHAAYFLGLAERAEPELTGAGQEAWLDSLEAELGNLRAAVGWACEPGGTGEVGLRVAGALWRFCYLRGHYAEGRDWLEETLALGGEGPPRARALMGAGMLALLRCEYDHAAARLSGALDLYRTLGDRRGEAAVLQVLGSVARERGRYAEARGYHGQSLSLWRTLGDEHGVASSLNYLGFLEWLQGRWEPARELCTETLERFRRLGDAEGVVWALISLGSVALYGEDPPRAEVLLQEGLDTSRRVGYREGIAWSLNQLGVAALGRGEPELAERRLRESLSEHRRLGDRWRTASVLEGLARTAAARGDLPRAQRLLGAAEGLRAEISTPIPPCERADRDRVAATLREAAGAAQRTALEEARAAGRSMPPERAVLFALGSQERPKGGGQPQAEPLGRAVLTRRQREVALLVAEGLTNRQIASSLTLSESTVANHVAAILRRLGLASRSRIAVWVAGGGLRGAG